MELLIQRIYEVFEANAAIFTAAGLEPVQTIDLYRGQPLNPERFEYYQTPALFLNYSIKWERQGKLYNGFGSLETHVVIDNPWETGSIFTNHAEALKKVFYHKLVRKILDNLESPNTSKLQRESERPVDTGVICYHILPYIFNYYDPEEIGNDTIEVNDGTLQITGKQLVKEL